MSSMRIGGEYVRFIILMGYFAVCSLVVFMFYNKFQRATDDHGLFRCIDLYCNFFVHYLWLIRQEKCIKCIQPKSDWSKLEIFPWNVNFKLELYDDIYFDIHGFLFGSGIFSSSYSMINSTKFITTSFNI